MRGEKSTREFSESPKNCVSRSYRDWWKCIFKMCCIREDCDGELLNFATSIVGCENILSIWPEILLSLKSILVVWAIVLSTKKFYIGIEFSERVESVSG